MYNNLKDIIEIINIKKNEADSYRPLKQEQEDRLIQKLKLDWNFHSSHIEGNSLTYSETKSFLLWNVTADGKPFKDYLEMKGHDEAVNYLLDVLKGNDIILTEHLIRHLHKTILQNDYEVDAKTSNGKWTKKTIKPGRYKTLPNHVKTKSGAMFYFATPEETPAKMMDLMNWYKNECNGNKIHPLIIASLFHYKFVRIHPFDDGNGRMARLLMNLILMKFGYPPIIIPFEIKDDYYNALQYADSDDFAQFIIFIGERLVESLELVVKAGKNEPLEEADDVDKMVKLLKHKIEGIDEDKTISKVLTDKTFKETFEESIKPLLIKLFDKIVLFIELFRDFELIYNFGEGEKILKTYRPDYCAEFLDACYDIMEKNLIINQIEIYFKFIVLKKSGSSPLTTGVRITLFFDQYNYEISSPSFNNLRITKLYHQILSENEINEITFKSSQYIKSKIEAYIKNLQES